MAGLLHRELLCQTACRVCEEGVMEMDPAHLEALRALGYTAEVSNRHPELQRPRTPPEHSIAQRIGRRTPRYPTPQECGRRASGAPIR
jgi:hypothetical protein